MIERTTLEKQLNSYVARTIASGVKPLETVLEAVYDCYYGEIKGYRASLTVNSVVSGTLYPEEYMRSAADGKLLSDISLKAIKKACKIKKIFDRAQEKDGLRSGELYIRCSSSLLEDSELYTRLKDVLSALGESGKGLYLEFYPEAFELDTEILKNAFRDIRAAGLKVAVDGYGGKDFPIEKVISVCPDVVFTSTELNALVTDRERYSAVAPLLNLVKSLGGKAIAEKVDYDEELREFRARDCAGFVPSEKYSGSTGATFKRITESEFIETYAAETTEESDDLSNAAESESDGAETNEINEINEEGGGNE